jgi:glucan 1,4-alpha-maltotetraohydrolase
MRVLFLFPLNQHYEIYAVMHKAPSVTRGNGKDIILQAFHWNLVKTKGTGTMDAEKFSWYKTLENLSDKIAAAGFTMVYLPPPWIDDSLWEKDGKHGGGEGYFWRDFDLNSRYGTKEELKSLVRTFHSFGLKVIVDVVINHRDRLRMQADIWPYPGPHWRVMGNDTGGAFLDGSSDLKLDHPDVYSAFYRALSELQNEVNVDGWRWDFVWGYHPHDVLSLIRDTEKIEYFSVGEYWQSGSVPDDPMFRRYGGCERDRLIGWASDSGSCVFDMVLKRELNTGNPANFKYGINCSKSKEERSSAVTIVDNHDTGASPYSPANGWGQRVWECLPDFKSQSYAFILSMPGTPCIYWPDLFDWNISEILDLIKIRKKAGIAASSEWIDLTDKHSGFAGIVCNEKGEPALAISIRSDFNDPGEGFVKAYEKPGQWIVWLKE